MGDTESPAAVVCNRCEGCKNKTVRVDDCHGNSARWVCCKGNAITTTTNPTTTTKTTTITTTTTTTTPTTTTSTTTTSTTTTSEAECALGELGVDGCLDGYVPITSPQVCNDVSSALGLIYDSSLHKDTVST